MARIVDCVTVARRVALRLSRTSVYSYAQLLQRAAALSDRFDADEEKVEKTLQAAIDAAARTHIELASIGALIESTQEQS